MLLTLEQRQASQPDLPSNKASFHTNTIARRSAYHARYYGQSIPYLLLSSCLSRWLSRGFPSWLSCWLPRWFSCCFLSCHPYAPSQITSYLRIMRLGSPEVSEARCTFLQKNHERLDKEG